jgi:GNAT superfamily N-acetyltransferase
VGLVRVRAATSADAAAVASVQRAGWFAAYSEFIESTVIDRVTTPDNGARVRQTFRTRPAQRMIVACASSDVVGYASYGPELEVLSSAWPYPVSSAGAAGIVGELYALYVHPDWWSTGTGHVLMSRVLSRLTLSGYGEVTLWVLEKNTRARRFYERVGFAQDGAVNALETLGAGVIEVRYRRVLKIV